MSKSEKAHMQRVAELSCVLCGALGYDGVRPVEIHHLRDGAGMAQRNSDFLTVPLCPSCHRGPKGVHGDRTFLKLAKLTELDLLAMTIERLGR